MCFILKHIFDLLCFLLINNWNTFVRDNGILFINHNFGLFCSYETSCIIQDYLEMWSYLLQHFHGKLFMVSVKTTKKYFVDEKLIILWIRFCVLIIKTYLFLLLPGITPLSSHFEFSRQTLFMHIQNAHASIPKIK